VLTRQGTLVVVGGKAGRWVQPAGHVMAALALSPFVPQTLTGADVYGLRDAARNLTELAALIENGQVAPVIDRTYAFGDIPAAVRYQETGHASGKVVVSVSSQ
jgi:NADPH:quinone reductase-like Zn-dependent oxidoreductase